MRLKDWAEEREQGIHYQTAWKWFRDGKLPVPALQTPSGTILVQPDAGPPPGGGLGLYARVASHDQRADLDRQVSRLSQWATTARAPLVRVEAEVAPARRGAGKTAAAAGRPGGADGGGDPPRPAGADERRAGPGGAFGHGRRLWCSMMAR